ncbi:MAG: tRNA (adenine(22)-N(1))-methyltransferase [Eubacterium sp.]|jgi:tRNA (adenine22-N1)-methyltransferase
MIKLTERLRMIAENISDDESAADIGTDHAYLPIWLMQRNPGRKVVLTDVSGGSLKKAKDNCALCGFPNADLRPGDGLDALRYGEVDCAVIAGMGGLLITDILAWDIAKTVSLKKYIFQPRNNSGALRMWLSGNGFDICREQIAEESGRYCEIITALSPASAVSPMFTDTNIKALPREKRFACEFPEAWASKPGRRTADFLRDRIKKEQVIADRIRTGLAGGNPDTRKDYEEAVARIERLEELLERAEHTYGNS